MEKKNIHERIKLGPILDKMDLPEWFPEPDYKSKRQQNGRTIKMVKDEEETKYSNNWNSSLTYLIGNTKKEIPLDEFISFLQTISQQLPSEYFGYHLNVERVINWEEADGIEIELEAFRLETDKELEARKKRTEKAQAAALVRKKKASQKKKEKDAQKEKEERELLKKLTEKYGMPDDKQMSRS